MSRLTYTDWKCYGILRSVKGKRSAEDYRHMMNAMHRERGTGNWPLQEWGFVFNDDGYGYIKKVLIPRRLTEVEKQELADDNWMTVYSPWDCTGQRFTRDIRFYHVPQGTWFYHFIGIDI